jgi:cytosine/adenosine deaminase-related metal-dependent hydrolase
LDALFGRKFTIYQSFGLLRKFRAEYIFDGYRFRKEDEVLIASGDGRIIDIVTAEVAGEGVEYFSGMLLPGFVNCHCHLDLSHLKGRIQDGTGLVDFLLRVLALRDAVSVEEKNDAMLRAMDQMHRSGTVAVGDICTGNTSLEIKKFSSLKWHNFIEVSGLSEAAADAKWQAALRLVAEYRSALPGARSVPSPHAPYSVSPLLFRRLNESTADEIIAIHNQESPQENQLFMEGKGDFLRLLQAVSIHSADFMHSGKSSLMYWTKFFNNRQKIISVHNTFTDTNDIEYTKKGQAGTVDMVFCLCPNANLFIESSLPPVEMLLKSGIEPVLGTDSLASNQQLNIWEEVKTVFSKFPVQPEALLSWATLNGARALGIADDFGSLEPGKRPGIVHVRKFHPRFWGESVSGRVL